MRSGFSNEVISSSWLIQSMRRLPKSDGAGTTDRIRISCDLQLVELCLPHFLSRSSFTEKCLKLNSFRTLGSFKTDLWRKKSESKIDKMATIPNTQSSKKKYKSLKRAVKRRKYRTGPKKVSSQLLEIWANNRPISLGL